MPGLTEDWPFRGNICFVPFKGNIGFVLFKGNISLVPLAGWTGTGLLRGPAMGGRGAACLR